MEQVKKNMAEVVPLVYAALREAPNEAVVLNIITELQQKVIKALAEESLVKAAFVASLVMLITEGLAVAMEEYETWHGRHRALLDFYNKTGSSLLRVVNLNLVR